MEKMQFLVSVRLSDGQSVQEIEDLDQAIRFLRDWPAGRRGPVYQTALNGCTAAKEGYLTVEEARKSLCGFARITGIMESEHPRSAVVTDVSKQRHLVR